MDKYFLDSFKVEIQPGDWLKSDSKDVIYHYGFKKGINSVIDAIKKKINFINKQETDAVNKLKEKNKLLKAKLYILINHAGLNKDDILCSDLESQKVIKEIKYVEKLKKELKKIKIENKKLKDEMNCYSSFVGKERMELQNSKDYLNKIKHYG